MTKSLSGKIVCEKHQWPTKDCVLCMSAIYESGQEVGRMEARIAELEWEYASVVNQFHDALAHNTRLESENQRLREALTRLRDCDWVISLPDRMDAVRDIAKAALLGGGENGQ